MQHLQLIVLSTFLFAYGSCTLLRCPKKAEMLPYFLGCLRNDIDKDFAGFEAEYTGALRKKVEACFPLTDSEAEEDECVFESSDYEKNAFNNSDTLGGCPACRAATSLIRNFLETANEQQMKNFRNAFSKTLAEDLQTCLGDLAFKQFPDIEGMEHTDALNKVNNLNLFMNAGAELISCEKAGSGSKSASCMTNRGSLGPDMPKHCAVAQSCAVEQLNQRCCNNIKSAVSENCDCLDSKKQHYMKQLLAAKGKLEKIETKEECNEIMDTLFESDGNVNWLSTVDKVASSFIRGIKVTSLLKSMCQDTEDRIQNDDPSLPQHLANIDGVLQFLALMIDASVSHMTDRFCHCDIDCSEAYTLKGNRRD